jgi:hypothetical protein
VLRLPILSLMMVSPFLDVLIMMTPSCTLEYMVFERKTSRVTS